MSVIVVAVTQSLSSILSLSLSSGRTQQKEKGKQNQQPHSSSSRAALFRFIQMSAAWVCNNARRTCWKRVGSPSPSFTSTKSTRDCSRQQQASAHHMSTPRPGGLYGSYLWTRILFRKGRRFVQRHFCHEEQQFHERPEFQTRQTVVLVAAAQADTTGHRRSNQLLHDRQRRQEGKQASKQATITAHRRQSRIPGTSGTN